MTIHLLDAAADEDSFVVVADFVSTLLNGGEAAVSARRGCKARPSWRLGAMGAAPAAALRFNAAYAQQLYLA
jgi:hypothetical protein